MATYLVTGTAGFIGYHLTKRLLQNGHKVIGLDSINDYYDTKLKFDRLADLGFDKRVKQFGQLIHSNRFHDGFFIRLNLEDAEIINQLVFGNYKFDAVIHLAAQAGVRYSIDHPFTYTQSNITGFLTILECCRHHNIPHLIYASSSSVYGMNNKEKFSENDTVDQPVSLYAATKRANELMAHTYSHLFNIPTTGLRFFTVYGPWGRPDMAYFKFAKAIINSEAIEIYNNGDMYRDFTYIDDIIEGILCILNKPLQNINNNEITPFSSLARVYNIGNNNPVKLSTFIEVLEQVIGKKSTKKYLPMQPGDVYRTAADITAISRDYNWKPHTDIESGLKYFSNWFLSYYNTRSN